MGEHHADEPQETSSTSFTRRQWIAIGGVIAAIFGAANLLLHWSVQSFLHDVRWRQAQRETAERNPAFFP